MLGRGGVGSVNFRLNKEDRSELQMREIYGDPMHSRGGAETAILFKLVSLPDS